jgi:hypothetical protein
MLGAGHAWLEKDGVAYCAVLDRFMPAAVFYREYRAAPVHGYDIGAAATEMRESGHWGPWDVELECGGYD